MLAQTTIKMLIRVLLLNTLVSFTYGASSVLADHNTTVQVPSGSQRYTIIDQTSQLPVTTVSLPPGWQIVELYTQDDQNPFNLFHFYQRDYFGPDGEVITYFFPFSVYHVLDENFADIWSGKFHAKLSSLGQFELGQITRSAHRNLLLPATIPQSVEFLERGFSGILLDDTVVEGRTYAMVVNGPFSAIVAAYAVISPAGRWEQTLSRFAGILQSGVEHPEFLAHAQRVGMRKMQLAQQQMSEQRRVRNKHMNTMRQMSEYQSTANKDFSARMLQRSDSLFDSAYGSTEAYNDYIKGTTSFNDPYTRHQISQQGHFDRWYTDSYGNYVGTNDPNFDSSRLSGFWQPIQPLGR